VPRVITAGKMAQGSLLNGNCLVTSLSEMGLDYQQFALGLQLFRRWSELYFSQSSIWHGNLLEVG